MRLNFYDETNRPIVRYIAAFLQDYMDVEYEGIFEFLCRNVTQDVSKTLKKVEVSLQFLSFYFAIANIGKAKTQIKRDEVFKTLVEYREVLKNFMRSEELSEKILDENIYSSELIFSDDEIMQALPYLHDNNGKYLKRFQRCLNKVLIETILNIAELLEKIGILNEYNRIANRKCRDNYLGKLELSMGEPIEFDFQKEFWDIFNNENQIIHHPTTVYEMFSPKYLSNLKTEKLIFICLFWANKLAKVSTQILKMLIFFQKNKSLLKGLKKGDIDLKTLNFYSKEFLGEDYWKILRAAYDGKPIEDVYLSEEIHNMFPMLEFLKKTYMLKELLIFFALESEGNDKSIKNYGLINESSEGRVVLVWDIPKMNLPVSVHIRMESLKYYYTKVNKQEKIRKYIGAEDFFSERYNWKNSFLYEIPKEKIDYIRTKVGLTDQIKHVLFIQTGIWPEHLRENGKVNKKYIALEDIK